MDKKLRLCWYCPHFHFNTGGQYYSELTPGYNATMSCAKNVWEFSFNEDDEARLAEVLSAAKDCQFFEPVKNLNNGKEG